MRFSFLGKEFSIGPRLKHEWISPEEFQLAKEKHVSRREQHFLNRLQTQKDIQLFCRERAPLDALRKIAKHLAQFEYGLLCLHRKTRIPYTESEILLLSHNSLNRGSPFTYVSKDQPNKVIAGKYLVELDSLIDLIFLDEKFKFLTVDHWGVEGISREDLMILAGIEEAAHRAYDHFGNDVWNQTIVNENYHTSDSETRAIYWKIAFVKRYFPQYLKDFQKKLAEIKSLRRPQKLERTGGLFQLMLRERARSSQ